MPAYRARWLLVVLATCAVVVPWLAPYDPGTVHRGYWHAPPMWPRAATGFAIHPVVLEDRIEQRFAVDLTRTVPWPWASADEPVFLLGADRSGRDVLSRLLAGARVSLGLGVLGVLGTVGIGMAVGLWAGARGGLRDDLVMRVADFVLVLPLLYVVLVLRAVLPLVLPPGLIFLLMLAIFVAVGWPVIAKVARGIVRREQAQEYVLAARAAGAGTGAILWRHLLPPCVGPVAVQASLLLPAFILAEATLSYVGLGFPDTVPTWGTMLREAADVNDIARFPWTLAPAAAIFLVTLVTNVALQPVGGSRRPASPARPAPPSPDSRVSR